MIKTRILAGIMAIGLAATPAAARSLDDIIADGTIRQKRSDTKIDTLRKTYGMDFAAQLPGNWPLAILRESTGMSLTELVSSPDAVQQAFPGFTAAADSLKAEDKTK